MDIDLFIDEVVKPVAGYEKDYLISNCGRLFSIKKSKPKLMSINTTPRGYKRVQISKNGKQKNFLIHRLVAIAFIENPDNKETVNHKNEKHWDNHIDNLEWMTNLENIRYGTGIKRRIKNTDYFALNQKSNLKKVKQVVRKFGGEIWSVYASIKETGTDGYDPTCVSRCCSGKKRDHKGSTFILA